MVVGVCIGRATRHALVVQPVQVQGIGAGDAGILTRTAAGAATLVARLAGLLRRLVVLGAQALDAQAVLEHKVRGARVAGQRSGALTGLAVMVALLAAVGRLVVALGTLGMAFAARQLPTLGTLHTLIATRTAARVAAQVALFAISSVAVVAVVVVTGRRRRSKKYQSWPRRKSQLVPLTHQHTSYGTRRSAATGPWHTECNSCGTRTECRCGGISRSHLSPCNIRRRNW